MLSREEKFANYDGTYKNMYVEEMIYYRGKSWYKCDQSKGVIPWGERG